LRAVVLLPSLSRPNDVKRFFRSYVETKSEVPVWVIVDDQDPDLENYEKIILPKGSELKITKDRTMGDKCRELWVQYKDMDAVFILNDDHVLETESWDKKVLSHIDGTNVVATNDGWTAPHRLAGAICFSGKVLRELGYLFLPGQHHLYSDDLWQNIYGRANATRILMDVMVRHKHVYKGEAPKDKTYEDINGPLGLVQTEHGNQGVGGMWPNDKRVFEEWLKGKAEEDVQKVINLQPKQGVMIATPSHDGNVAMSYALGLTDTATAFMQNGIYFELARVVGSSLIPHARNSLVDMFLRSRCQKLLMIDADQGFDRNAVLHLFHSQRMIVAGITPHKRFPINLNFKALPQDEPFFQSQTNKGLEEFKNFAQKRADQQGCIEVDRVGTGIIMIDRRVFELMKDHIDYYEPFDDKPAKHGEYFKMGGSGKPGEVRRYYGEDWFFTELAKKLNIPIHINANVIVSHQGTYVFTA
jgi:hypothetical protein